MSRKLLLISCSLLLAFVTGCANEPAVTTEQNDSGMFSGEVDPAANSFQYEIAETGEPSRTGGPFILYGRNIRYDDGQQALLVDLSVENKGERTLPEPVVLTFTRLLPPNVTVLNPDNEENGPGAMIYFEFENDDAMWTQGEESFPRTVAFGVAPQSPVGFSARLDVGISENGGAIGGVVWNDKNRNGERENDEEGLPGMEVLLRTQNPEGLMIPEILRRAVTGRDGTYRFDNLSAGHYVLAKRTNEKIGVTTDPEIHVVLVETDSGVSDFFFGDFGCALEGAIPIAIGDFVEVVGAFMATTAVHSNGFLVAKTIRVHKCDRVCVRAAGLGGTVVDKNDEDRTLRIMDEWISFAARDSVPDDSTNTVVAGDLQFDDVERGDRVYADVTDIPNGVLEPLPGLNLRPHEGDAEVAAGYVKRIGGTTVDRQATLIILRRTAVLVNEETAIEILED